MPMPTLSLCMIVRDEEVMLPACLASVAGAVDEIVVVDTGSRDRTVAIARAAGAVVVEQPWADDFSAPRNRAIEESRCDWVLILDADERLTSGARETLRRALEAAEFDCGMLPLHNAARLDADIERVARGEDRIGERAFLPRLMRRTVDLRFSGIVHENVGSWLFSNDRKAKFLEGVDIVHLGGVPTLREQRDKSQRNIRLLERSCAEHPGDVNSYGYLAHEYLELGDVARARDVAERGWAVFAQGATTLDLPLLRLTTARAWLQVQSSETLAAHETLSVASRVLAKHPDVFFIRGCAFEMEALRTSSADVRRESLTRALAEYQSALGCAEGVYLQKFVEGGSSWAAEVRCGTVSLLLGRTAEARGAFERAIAEKPTSHEAQWGRLECLLVAGENLAVIRELQPFLDERPDGWTLAALAAEAAGSFDAMGQWLGKAQSFLGRGFVAPHRRERYYDALIALGARLGHVVEAPGPLGQLVRLANGAPCSIEQLGARSIEEPLARAMARRLVMQWLRTGHAEKVERLVVGAADAWLPGILELTSRVVDELTAGQAGAFS
jgi:tetratricopeptide (TPR) repeat protein